MVNFITAVAYHFCLALPAAFTQPGDHLFAEPSWKRRRPLPDLFMHTATDRPRPETLQIRLQSRWRGDGGGGKRRRWIPSLASRSRPYKVDGSGNDGDDAELAQGQGFKISKLGQTPLNCNTDSYTCTCDRTAVALKCSTESALHMGTSCCLPLSVASK